MCPIYPNCFRLKGINKSNRILYYDHDPALLVGILCLILYSMFLFNKKQKYYTYVQLKIALAIFY